MRENRLNEAGSLTKWQRFWLVVKVVELRLRFVALLAATALVFAHWDTIWNHVDRWRRPELARAETNREFEYFCPMHPSVVRDVHGSCPICGMPLSERKRGAREELPHGVTARLRLAPFQVQQAGVRTSPVAYAELTDTIETVGTVAIDERRQARISSRTKGTARVEKLYVNFTGGTVKAGDVLAEVYSPEVYQASQELIMASRALNTGQRGNAALLDQTTSDGKELLRSTSEKLRLWGLTEEQVSGLLRDGKPATRVPIVSPIGGVVLRKEVVEGQYLNEGDALFELADLDHVWINAQLFEHQLALVNVGDSVEARVTAFPGETFEGTVAFVDPVLDPATRTVKVRFDLANPGGSLRPGMFANVSLQMPLSRTPAVRAHLAKRAAVPDLLTLASLTVEQQRICLVTGDALGSMGEPVAVEVAGKSLWACCGNCEPALRREPNRYLAKLAAPPKDATLVLPESAVIDTGSTQVVFVEVESGVFEGRAVVLGARAGGFYPVLEGLDPGAKVATHGAFLLDAETRLNPALGATYFGGRK